MGTLVVLGGKSTSLGRDGSLIFPWTTSLAPINSLGKTLREGNYFIPWSLRESGPGLQAEKARGFSPGGRLAGHCHTMAGDAKENGGWWQASCGRAGLSHIYNITSLFL